jgi:integrase
MKGAKIGRRVQRRLATNWADALEAVDVKTDYLQYTWWMVKVWHPACAAVGPFLDEEGDEWRPTPHTLRHAHATWASDAGVPAQDIQDNHDHEQLQPTEIYLQRPKKIIRTTSPVPGPDHPHPD